MALPEERMRIAPVDRTMGGVQALPGARVSWGGVWSGLLIALGALLLLTMLGLAVGISAIDVGPGQSPGRGLGVGAAVWSGLSLLISLFLGGLVAARMGLIAERGSAVVQGALSPVIGALVDQDLEDGARNRRGDLGVHFVGRDLNEDLVLGDGVAYLLRPSKDGSLGDRLAELGH